MLLLVLNGNILDKVVQNSQANGLPNIAVSDCQGKFLNLLAKTMGAKRVLKIGTLGGYSTIWMARALPDDSKVITCEVDDEHAKVAQENINTAGLADRIEIIKGPALNSIHKLGVTPFDLVFIDANKEQNLDYFTEAKRLVRKGGVITVDNVVWFGKVADPSIVDENTEGIRDLLKSIQGDEEVEASTICTAGERGFDGFIYALRR
ncbi:O-methyltransferase family 3 protein [Mycena floridula]|nr:O-methyltransferase family 3 protein [Mycena floridula]